MKLRSCLGEHGNKHHTRWASTQWSGPHTRHCVQLPHNKLAYSKSDDDKLCLCHQSPNGHLRHSHSVHCIQRPPTTNALHDRIACVNSNHRLIISHGNSIISNEIIPASYPYFRICSQTLSTKIGLHPRLHTMLLLVYAITCRRNSASQVHRFVISSEYGSFFSLPSNFVSRHNSTMWDIV